MSGENRRDTVVHAPRDLRDAGERRNAVDRVPTEPLEPRDPEALFVCVLEVERKVPAPNTRQDKRRTRICRTL